ncbi:unnamed protein product [Mycena citricolor]|uniref:Non-ribosomal peptide synthetase n=1 Tax=Mycena citricolor TaxID=2018698 RepID=A0AAD2HPQ6_9AGAR|nr:unnamed protein product [Mycena citricolor]CAK5278803.1 unnamed protein product [Mycena citricolor]
MQLITGPVVPPTHSPRTELDASVTSVYPMTRAQEGIWMAYSAQPQHTLYNLTMKFTLASSDTYSMEKVLAGIQTLTARHGILRSTFHGNKSVLSRPFVAEWDAQSALPSVRIVAEPKTAIAKMHLQKLLHQAVPLSEEFAVRWLVVELQGAIEVYVIAHHIALDGTSMSELSGELLCLLDGKAEESKPIGEVFQKAHMMESVFRGSGAFQLAKEFWLSQSRNTSSIQWKGVPKVPESQNYREIARWSEFSKDQLAQWSARHRTSWFRVALAVVALLTQSHSIAGSSRDQTLTVAFGGRPKGLDRTVGHFANALPIRVPVSHLIRSSSTITFDALLRLLSTTVSTAKKHERFSFTDLSQACLEEGCMPPRAQVAVTLSPKLEREECELYPVEGPYDLFFCFLEAADSVSLGVIYDPTLFDQKSIAALKVDFERIVAQAMAETPFDLQPLLGSRIPCLMPPIDTTDAGQVSKRRFHAMFEHQAARNPAAVAMSCAERDESMTYGEMNERANQMANALRQLGMGRTHVVLLHLKRGFSTLCWILAVLKAGATYAIADQGHPLERTRSAMAVAEPDLIVDDGMGIEVGLFSGTVKILRTDTCILDAFPRDNLEDVSQDDDLAYIVFTSGSTGQPKGVEITHSSLSNWITAAHAAGYFPMGPFSRVLQFATFAFDAAVLEWSLALSLGSNLCFANTPQALIGDYLADVIDKNLVTHMHLTPSVLGTLPASRRLQSLECISVGGEMVPDNLIERWRTRVTLQNAYGPTEATVVMAHRPQPSSPGDAAPSAANIGKPHSPTEVFVCNPSFDRLLAVNEVGEVCLAGPQLARGYRNRADLTSQRFAVHPQNGKRMYKTGDRGKLLADGTVVLMGRMDRELKVRGYRIDLDDLERTVVAVMPSIISVSVQSSPSGTDLCVFVSPQTVDGTELKRLLGLRVPSYMVPRNVYCLPRLPLNTSDKTDHKVIKLRMEELIRDAKFPSGATTPISTSSDEDDLSSLEDSSRSSTLADSTMLQADESVSHQDLTNVWIELLELKSAPSGKSSFFDLGGNSLLAQTLIEKVRGQLPSGSLSVSVLDLFTYPCLDDFIPFVQSRAPAKVTAPRVKGPRMSRQSSTKSLAPASQVDTISSLTNIWKSVLQLDRVAKDASFFDAGGNSLLMTTLHKSIVRSWPGCGVQLIDLFQNATIQSQAELIAVPSPVHSTAPSLKARKKRASATGKKERVASRESAGPDESRDIAIVGIAGRFPGSSSPQELYQLLLDQTEALTHLCPDSPVEVFPGGVYVPHRGALKDVWEFDGARWGIKAEEAEEMDPQQKLLMTVAQEALEDASAVPPASGPNKIGLFVGAAPSTWVPSKPDEDAFHHAHREALTPCLSALTAYHLNLQGPNVTLHTACSSGMVAMSLAVDNLRSKTCDVALAGGVSVAFPQAGYLTAPTRLFSPSGHCRPFDSRSDGTLPGDAVCALVLKRMSDAVRDGDDIYAVVKGMAVGSDGKPGKAGPTVPSPRGQAQSVKGAWMDAGVSAGKLVYAEWVLDIQVAHVNSANVLHRLHGSGTPIGDALELEGLKMARRELGVEKTPYIVGSNKGNLGNCEAASGLVSVIKLVKSIQHGVVPPLQSFEQPNPVIDPTLKISFAKNPVRLSPDALLSASSTGLGGVNAHCVLAFPPAQHKRKASVEATFIKGPVDVSVEVPSPKASVPDATSAGHLVLRHVRSILGTDEISSTTVLRDAGLDSRGQMALLHQLQQAGCHIPLSAFIDPSCTVESIVASISASLPSYISFLQQAPTGTTYVLIAPGGGSCLSYAALARHLPADSTIMALDHPALHGIDSDCGINELATRYVKDMPPTCRDVVLVGASFGGLVATAMLGPMQEAGIQVRAVALIDSPFPGSTSADVLLTADAFVRNVFSAESRPALSAEEATLDLAAFAARHGSDIRALAGTYEKNVKAMADWLPSGPHTTSALYVAAATDEVDERWKAAYSGMSVERVEGEHAGAWIGDNASKLAGWIAGLLAAQSAS